MKECENMGATAVVAEFNPLHNGHKYIIDTLKSRGDTVVCILGDDFTQRSEAALISKYDRTDTALSVGADLCVLMPVVWSMSCAYNFALGGMSIAKALGNIDSVAFGSECGDIKKIIRVADALRNEKLSPLIKAELKGGVTFAAAREKALFSLIGEDAGILKNPNDTLAVEYITAARNIGFNPEFIAIKRKGNGHDSKVAADDFLSASNIRSAVLSGNADSIKEYIPEYCYTKLNECIENGKIHDTKALDSAVISHLRRLSTADILTAPEVAEGLENLIFEAARNTRTAEECAMYIKSKRYTLARIKRILMSLFLGITVDTFGKEVPYIKVLGFNKNGEEFLKNTTPAVPLIMRGKDYNDLDGFAATVFKIQCLASDMYGMCAAKNTNGLTEFSEKLIKK